MEYFLFALFIVWTWLWYGIGHHDGWANCLKMVRKAAEKAAIEVITEEEDNER